MAKIMAKKKVENLSFEDSVQALETIVEQLEQGDATLEESMSLFERGLALTKSSQQKLENAEQKVQILLSENGEQTLATFKRSTTSDQS